MKATYTHTNLTARNWQTIAKFYCDVFGCVPVPPERDLSGAWLERLTAVPGAHLRGIHLALPGFKEGGPTLEIFTYTVMLAARIPVVNEPGFGHLAFHVDDVEAVLSLVRNHGGSSVGEVSSTTVPGVGLLRVVYARDPEGNILELQNWTKTA